MATDAQTLLTAAQCYACFASNDYTIQLMKLSLLRQILLAQNPTAMTDAQTLLDQAKCYQCHGSNSYMMQMMELALLAQISNNGGGGGTGSGSVLSGAGLPTVIYPAGPPGGGTNALYTDSNTGILYSWYGGAWH